jgi:hypothetical protein
MLWKPKFIKVLIKIPQLYPNLCQLNPFHTLTDAEMISSIRTSATGLWAGRSEFDFRQKLGIFLYATASKPALGPTQPPIQWILGVPYPGSKAAGALPLTSI